LPDEPLPESPLPLESLSLESLPRASAETLDSLPASLFSRPTLVLAALQAAAAAIVPASEAHQAHLRTSADFMNTPYQHA